MALSSVAFQLQQSIRNQTDVSVTLTTHLLSNKFPNSNNNAAEVANEVNAWAEKHTNGLIKKVLEANAIDRLTWLIFANAAYFKGSWSQKFDRSKTKESIFHLLDGNNVQVPFMTSKKKQLVSEYDDFKILGLPYIHGEDERRLTMYFLLPHAKDGLQSLLEKISSQPNFFDRHIPVRKVPVAPPWCKPPVVDFVADHPFLFVIREDVTKVMLFMGQVIDPSVG
ncbi:hypothetical protein L1987_80431 [Smallanthus sonchifolius]|uniref:Uncharacterized protein n=1 Tax=Smallanthus sonchifolius TaxID=185202 RepID=A0ACB8YNB2_9ASTR|nr:hypothetical protein L1987_80431 [Smallanthus sonchifolius]